MAILWVLNEPEFDNGLNAVHFAMLQRLGKPLLLSQSIVIYSFYAMNVFAFCWFGSELSVQASVLEKVKSLPIL
jgi:hypothetical protein